MFITKYIGIFVKNVRSFCIAKTSLIFSTKILTYFRFNVRNVNQTLSNKVISFERLDPDMHQFEDNNAVIFVHPPKMILFDLSLEL